MSKGIARADVCREISDINSYRMYSDPHICFMFGKIIEKGKKRKPSKEEAETMAEGNQILWEDNKGRLPNLEKQLEEMEIK